MLVIRPPVRIRTGKLEVSVNKPRDETSGHISQSHVFVSISQSSFDNVHVDAAQRSPGRTFVSFLLTQRL